MEFRFINDCDFLFKRTEKIPYLVTSIDFSACIANQFFTQILFASRPRMSATIDFIEFEGSSSFTIGVSSYAYGGSVALFVVGELYCGLFFCTSILFFPELDIIVVRNNLAAAFGPFKQSNIASRIRHNRVVGTIHY